MKIEVNGVEYTNFTTGQCELRLDALCNTFNFTAVASKGQPLPFKGGESCRVLVDGERVLTGNIEVVRVSYDGSDHNITISGRDRPADLLDSTIDNMDDLRGENLTLKGVIEAVLKHIGSDVSVVDEVNPEPFSATEDIAAPEPGENAFAFIEKFARKRQVLLTSNADGNIVIASNSGVTAAGAVQHIIGAEDNNVMRCDFSYDTTGRYNLYKMSSELNPVALNNAGASDLAATVNQGGGVSDTQIRTGRQLVLVSETPYSNAQCTKRATWEADVRKARGLAYSAYVPGFRVGGSSGALWNINRIYQIVDDFVGKIEPMLCNSVSFTFDASQGSNTLLGFVGQKAYTVTLEPDPYAEIATDVS